MTYRKMIAFGCALVLTLCGMAVANQQGIGWHFDMMRASAVSGGWVNPDPNAANLMLWISFDNIPMTGSLNVVNDIPLSGSNFWPRLDSIPSPAAQYTSSTNVDGVVDYGLKANGAALWYGRPSGWSNICSSLGNNGWGSGYTISICSSNFTPGSGNYNLCFITTTNETGPQHYVQMNLNSSGQHLFRLGSNGALEANITGTLTTNGHAVITWSSNSFAAYQNGVQVGTTDTSCPTKMGTNLTTTASAQFSANPHYRDIRIYNRALTSQEVWNLYVGMNYTNPIWAKPQRTPKNSNP